MALHSGKTELRKLFLELRTAWFLGTPFDYESLPDYIVRAVMAGACGSCNPYQVTLTSSFMPFFTGNRPFSCCPCPDCVQARWYLSRIYVMITSQLCESCSPTLSGGFCRYSMVKTSPQHQYINHMQFMSDLETIDEI